MIRAHKIRLNPTPEQEVYFQKACGVARFTFNWGLSRWKELCEAGQKPAASSLKAEFNALKGKLFPWVYEVTKCAVEGAFVNLGNAFAHFFRRVKNGEREVGYPRFKSKKHSKQSFYIANDKISFNRHEVNIPKLGWVNMAEPLRFAGKVMGATVTRQAGRWFISVSIEDGQEPPPKREGDTVGIDLGVSQLVVTSDGHVFENQKQMHRALKRLKHLHRELSRKQSGSHNREKAKLRLSRAYERVANLRNDTIHKLTTWLVHHYTFIGMEDLNTQGMLQNHKLALSISDASFFEIRRQLEYKAEWYGSFVQLVDRFFPSSKLCSGCSYVNTELALSERYWTCPICLTEHHRDINAAINIKREALRLAYE